VPLPQPWRNLDGIVLVAAIGIEVPRHPIADFFPLSRDQMFDLS
jgi:hypothetical protein